MIKIFPTALDAKSRKLISILVCTLLMYGTAQTQHARDSLFLTNGDTLAGSILSWEQSGLFSRKKVVIKLDDGSKWDYFIRNVDSFVHNRDFYKPLPKRPGKDNQNLVFCRLIMYNDSIEIYKYDDLVTSDFGPVYDWKYYLYISGIYRDDVDRKNYKQILKDHFGDCSYIQGILSQRKNMFKDDRFSLLAEKYMKSCH